MTGVIDPDLLVAINCYVTLVSIIMSHIAFSLMLRVSPVCRPCHLRTELAIYASQICVAINVM